ncbi:hypothetical protein BKA93DRAFT_798546, partial [Sparassis latifolia]
SSSSTLPAIAGDSRSGMCAPRPVRRRGLASLESSTAPARRWRCVEDGCTDVRSTTRDGRAACASRPLRLGGAGGRCTVRRARIPLAVPTDPFRASVRPSVRQKHRAAKTHPFYPRALEVHSAGAATEEPPPPLPASSRARRGSPLSASQASVSVSVTVVHAGDGRRSGHGRTRAHDIHIYICGCR